VEKTTLYLPAELQRGLREAARRQGRSQADLVREAVTRYLAEQPRRLPKAMGALRKRTGG
jgi:predicted DNA-binding protein